METKEKPIPLKEWVEKNCPDKKEFVNEIIRIYNGYNSYLHGKICEICDIELTQEEIDSILPYDFLYTCKEHKEHKIKFQPRLVRKKLGLPERHFINWEYLNGKEKGKKKDEKEDKNNAMCFDTIHEERIKQIARKETLILLKEFELRKTH